MNVMKLSNSVKLASLYYNNERGVFIVKYLVHFNNENISGEWEVSDENEKIYLDSLRYTSKFKSLLNRYVYLVFDGVVKTGVGFEEGLLVSRSKFLDKYKGWISFIKKRKIDEHRHNI